MVCAEHHVETKTEANMVSQEMPGTQSQEREYCATADTERTSLPIPGNDPPRSQHPITALSQAKPAQPSTE